MNNSIKSIRKLKGVEQGRSAFILANGPSVLVEPLNQLPGHLIIGMNGSTALELDYGFTQDYYTVSDRRFLTHPQKCQWATSKLKQKTRRIVRSDISESDPMAGSDRTFTTPHLKRDGFSRDLAAGFYYGCTTTMLAIQLAAYLGCKKIYLMGVDLRYQLEQPRCYAETSPQVEDAFTSVQIWNIANAARVLSKHGVTLSNCSKNSLLRPYLPFIPFIQAIEHAIDAEAVRA